MDFCWDGGWEMVRDRKMETYGGECCQPGDPGYAEDTRDIVKELQKEIKKMKKLKKKLKKMKKNKKKKYE